MQTYQILTNNDKVCIPSLSSILLAVTSELNKFFKMIPLRYLAGFPTTLAGLPYN